MSKVKIILETEESKEFSETMHYGLHGYNIKNCAYIRENCNQDCEKEEKIIGNVILYDDKKVIGGAEGQVRFGWYHLENLWISEEYRGKDHGTKIIEMIEEFAKEKGAIGIRTETWSFQAPNFYKKQGFIEYGKLEDSPPGYVEYLFYKKFN